MDNNYSSAYTDSDHVGTPESYQEYVIAGGTGGGGTNYTGTHSGAVSMKPLVLATLSGYVLDAGTLDGIGGIRVYLEDQSGDTFNVVTNSDGSYSFTGLQPGEYTLYAIARRPLYVAAGDQVGTVDGIAHGTDVGNLTHRRHQARQRQCGTQLRFLRLFFGRRMTSPSNIRHHRPRAGGAMTRRLNKIIHQRFTTGLVPVER